MTHIDCTHHSKTQKKMEGTYIYLKYFSHKSSSTIRLKHSSNVVSCITDREASRI
jgi:hypothetical protein